jgi:hypothetical protein
MLSIAEMADVIDAAKAEVVDLRAKLLKAEDRADRLEWSHEVLHDLVDLRHEESVMGQWRGFKEREAKAWANAQEIFEP